MIYLCIPAKDEAATIGVLLWKIRKVMAGFGRDYEVIVLDDGSRDETAEVVGRYMRSLPLSLLRETASVGPGQAVRRLLEEASMRSRYPKRDCAIVLQGDFSENPEDIPGLVKAIEGGADLVAGNPEEDAIDPAPRDRRWVRRGARLLLGSTLRRAPVSDPLCGFRAYRIIIVRKALREGGLPLSGKTQGWAANLHLLGAVSPFARRIEEVPVRLRYRDLPRDTRFEGWGALRSLWDVRKNVRWAPPSPPPSPASPVTPSPAVPVGDGGPPS